MKTCLLFIASIVFILLSEPNKVHAKNCSELLYGQYYCSEPAINETTQQPQYCARDNSIIVKCLVAKGLYCSDMDPQTRQFNRTIENGCQFTSNQKNFSTALLLSVFFGWLGLDRFYLGYYAIGLLKLFSFGFFFILYLLDIVLITLQLLEPADGSGYSMPYYGPKSYNVHGGNESSMAFYGCFDCLFVIP